ncbi:MAG: lambda-exonuclease family protein, partial [Candidatus Gastranaerophilaceae bacterium]
MFTVEERRNYIGGSDIAAVMGMSRWKTQLQLWLEKTGEVEPVDLSQVEAVQLGSELEEFVAQKFAKETGKQVRKQSKMYVHKDYPYMVAHIDRLITGTDEILECKT